MPNQDDHFSSFSWLGNRRDRMPNSIPISATKILTKGLLEAYPIDTIPIIVLTRPSDVRFAKLLFIHDFHAKAWCRFNLIFLHRPILFPVFQKLTDRQRCMHGEAHLTCQCFVSFCFTGDTFLSNFWERGFFHRSMYQRLRPGSITENR